MRKSLFIGLVAILSLFGCSRNQEIDVPDANLSIFAKTESPADTKTVVESGVHVFWEPGDEIAVFTGEQSAKFTTDITAASGTATFKGTFGDATWPEDIDLWAVYPFSEDAVFDGETITTTLPSEQVAREGSFGKDMNLAISHSNSSTLQFYNVGGGIRFSVTEEGIKKVMFEGLSREIISGKVKIGFEDGLPVVKEVTGGSQFITLLPPTGQETFQPGAWYYIVAIPGSLEGGYKLRFYKDTDYARKVSEKAVEIKRSVFGNVEKADDGINFEPQTTHFPETDDEIVVSVALTQSIHKEVYSILWENKYSGEKDINEIVEEILQIDGVIFAKENDDKSAIAVIQKDSVCVNYILKGYISDLDTSFLKSEERSSFKVRRRLMEENEYAPNLKDGKKALILAPFQWDFKVNIDNCWVPALYENYSDRIQYLPDKEAGILQFKQELHDTYDFILIFTHGTTGFCTHPILAFGQVTTAPTWDTFLSSSTQYSADVLKKLIKDGNVSVKETGIIAPPESSIEYLGISTEVLEGASYNDSCVLIFACESAELLNNKRPWLDAFTSKGALAVSGARVSMDSKVLGPTADKLVQMMTLGCSFRDAFNYVTKSSTMSHWSNAIYEYVLSNEKTEYEAYDVYNNYVYKQNELKPTQDFFLSNPSALLNEPQVGDESISFSWISFPMSFPQSVSWYYSVNSSEKKAIFTSISYDRFFDVYLDGNRIDQSFFESSDNTKQTVTYARPSVGEHYWKVVTNIIEKDSGIIIGSYSSIEERFTVFEKQNYETPEAKDLGLSVKWGSFNLGASKPEMPGEYFAWGETETYYSRLVPSTIWKEGKEAGYDWPSYKWCNGSSSSITKYNTSALTQLEPEDDAAHVKLGDKWRIPTEDEWAELRNNCSFTWTSLNGVNGLLVTSLKPGYTNVSIFLPAAGVVGNTSLYYLGESGFYWTSGNNTSNKENAGYNTFETGSSGLGYGWIDRCYGLSIRPVYGDQMPPINGDIEGTEEDPWN